MNQLDDVNLDPNSFSFDDIQGKDSWLPFTVVFGSLTIVGAPAYSGRMRFVGRWCQFQVQFSAGTSIASTAGTDYLTLPVAGQGLTGQAAMTNQTTHIAVGLCHVDVAAGKAYLPTQLASGNTFHICGSYEV